MQLKEKKNKVNKIDVLLEPNSLIILKEDISPMGRLIRDKRVELGL